MTIIVFLSGIYTAALLQPMAFVPAFTLLLLGNCIGLISHELSHYLISRCWMKQSDVHINLTQMYAEFDAPYDAPPWAIRIIAGSPYLLMLTTATIYYSVSGFPGLSIQLLNSYSDITVAAFLVGLGFGVSASDLLGILYPMKFQEFASKNHKKDEHGAWSVLKHSVRN